MVGPIRHGGDMIITIIAFLFILGFSVSIHEFGHFLSAKTLRIPVLKFSLGFGPAIFKKKIGETDFVISMLPVGGYVKLEGEDEGEGGFFAEPGWKRIIVFFLGPLFNVASAFGVLFLVFSLAGIMVNPYRTIVVEPGSSAERVGLLTGDTLKAINDLPVDSWESVVDLLEKNKPQEILLKIGRAGAEYSFKVMDNPDSLGIKPLIPALLGSVKRGGPASRAGLRKGDLIGAINGIVTTNWDEMTEIIRRSAGDTLTIGYLRAGRELQTTVVPKPLWDETVGDTVGQINVMMDLGRRRVSVPHAFSLAIQRGGDWLVLTGQILYKIITGKVSRKNIGGPIAIAKTAGESARWGIENLFFLLAIISVNLGIVNLIPLPAFDGGLIVITLFEEITRRPLKKKERQIIQQIGFAIIILLILFVTFNDLTR